MDNNDKMMYESPLLEELDFNVSVVVAGAGDSTHMDNIDGIEDENGL